MSTIAIFVATPARLTTAADRALVSLVMTDNDSPSLESIHAEFQLPVSRLCRRMIGNEEAAKDAAQEVWCEIVRSFPAFEGRSKTSTWVWTIARRTIFRQRRREKTYSARFLRELFEIREADGVEEIERIPVEDRMAWIRIQCDECLSGIMHCLGQEERFVYLLRALGALPFAEIAEVLERAEPAVRKAYSRSSAKIRRFLAGNCSLYNPDGDCRCKLSEPMRRVDAEGEYRRVAELARHMAFLEAAESYHPPKEYWKGLLEPLQTT
jgi:RNA polymerase sigma-70 factor (ECF subfamily)